ncbi:hypothetical protein L345_07638, partial [Ophiophagus hannah]
MGMKRKEGDGNQKEGRKEGRKDPVAQERQPTVSAMGCLHL